MDGLKQLRKESFVFLRHGEESEYAQLAYHEFDKNHAEVA